MARLWNRHCANCIGTLSFPIEWPMTTVRPYKGPSTLAV